MQKALVILCGGNSTRMGSDKALLPFGDCCLIEYLVRKFQPHFSNIYLSVKKKGDYAHLHLPVTEIPDIYSGAGPMSGIFSGLSMIDEEKAFFMSVDTPFFEPQTALALLEAIGDADICSICRKTSYLENLTAAYSKNCITSIGKCLFLHQFTFKALHEKCQTKYLAEHTFSEFISVPVDVQFFNLDTRTDYYHALQMLSCFHDLDSSTAVIDYFNENKDLFLQALPTLSFVSKTGTLLAPFLNQLILLLKRDFIEALYLTIENQDLIIHNIEVPPVPENVTSAFTCSDLILIEYSSDARQTGAKNKIEVLRKGWSEAPVTNESDLLCIVADFPYVSKMGIPVFDMKKLKAFEQFVKEFVTR